MNNYKQNAKSFPIFKNLSEYEKSTLLKDGQIRHFEKKESLFRHGDPLLNFYIICSGNIQIFRSNSNGDEKTSEILMSTDVICDNKIYEFDSTYQYNATAIYNATVIEFPKIWLRENIKKYGNFALNLLIINSHHMQMAEIATEHRMTMSATQIVACFLQELCLIYNFDPRGFELPYSKKLIASRLGMQLESFSRTLPQLLEYGITIAGHCVTIDNYNTIEQNVCNHCSVEENCLMRKNFKQKLVTSQRPNYNPEG